MFNNDKKIKVLISNIIVDNKPKAESLVREIVESTIIETEQIIMESFFKNVRKGALNG